MFWGGMIRTAQDLNMTYWMIHQDETDEDYWIVPDEEPEADGDQPHDGDLNLYDEHSEPMPINAENDLPWGTDHVFFGTDDASGDNIQGSEDDDLIFGLEGVDTLRGAGGNDTVYGNSHDDIIYLGFKEHGDQDTSDLRDVGHGGQGNDTIHGTDASDELNGGTGIDLLVGNAGDDVINGGSERDTASYEFATGSVEVNLTTGRSSGADGNDTLESVENVRGSQHNDTLIGNDEDNSLIGLGGDDELRGGDGGNSLHGGDGNDTIYGGKDDDFISTGAGNDSVEAGAGDDIIFVDTGNDTIFGGSGADKFVFRNEQFGVKTIKDWEAGIDRFDIRDHQSDVAIQIGYLGNDALIVMADVATNTILGAVVVENERGNISMNDFDFFL